MITLTLLGQKVSFENNNIIVMDNKINIFLLLFICSAFSFLLCYVFVVIVFGNFENIISFF